jgi:hypothetical protein
MSWNPSGQEMQAVLRLDGRHRYEYCIKKVADESKIWGLKQGGLWALMKDDTGRQVMPVWPHRNYASLCAVGAWDGYTPDWIEIDKWISRWLPGLDKDGRLVAVFSVPEGYGVVVDPQKMKLDLSEEISLYE